MLYSTRACNDSQRFPGFEPSPPWGGCIHPGWSRDDPCFQRHPAVCVMCPAMHNSRAWRATPTYHSIIARSMGAMFLCVHDTESWPMAVERANVERSRERDWPEGSARSVLADTSWYGGSGSSFNAASCAATHFIIKPSDRHPPRFPKQSTARRLE